MAGKAQYQDGYWWSGDGLRLHYRDYPGRDDRPVIVCLPGLTRNARDFAALAERLAGEWRVICVDLRGRGESGYAKDPMTYLPLTYVQDVSALLASLEIKRFAVIGTSLGGLMAMLLAATGAERLAGALLNDVGPALEEDGLARIRTYVGKSANWPTWAHAARTLAEQQGSAYPDYSLIDWIAMAKRVFRLNKQGRVIPDYDLRIAEPFRLPVDAIDLWPALDAFGALPVLVVHGGLSDILSADNAAAMVKRLPNATLATVPRVGHAPQLDEPEALVAIDAWLAKIAR